MVGRSVAERLADIREAAPDLRDIVADTDTDAFHALLHAGRMADRAIKNALTELGEAVKSVPADITKRHAQVDLKDFARPRDLVAYLYSCIDTIRLPPIIRDDTRHPR